MGRQPNKETKQMKRAPSAKTRKKSPQPLGYISAKSLGSSYKHTLQQVQAELSPLGRYFSKFIHLEAIETMSSFVGSTIARPNAILFGSILAFVATITIYFIAKSFGYVLSGFESIGAFIIGWLIGNVLDYLHLIIKGRKY